MANAKLKGGGGFDVGGVSGQRPRGHRVGLSGQAPGSRPLKATVTRLGCPGLPRAWSVFEVGIIGWVGDRKEASLC